MGKTVIKKKDKKDYLKSTICYVHGRVQQKLGDIADLVEGPTYDINIEKLKKELEELVKDANELVEICLEKGTKMENRLKLYKNAIEELGFKRKKK